MMRRLGKRAPRIDHRTLKLSKYTAALAPPPEVCNLTARITNLGEMLNDTLGDCTCAAIGHTIQAWTAFAGKQVVLADPDILAAYEAFCGYVPGNAATDQGGVELDVLNGWRKTGVAGHTIDAYATLQKKPGGLWGKITGSSWRHDLMNAVYYFGTAYIGVTLPDAVLGPGVIPWIIPANPTSSWKRNPDNGHAVTVVGYDADGVWVITWGMLLRASWLFLDECMDEGYCPFARDIFSDSGKSPQNFDLATLQNDLNSVTA